MHAHLRFVRIFSIPILPNDQTYVLQNDAQAFVDGETEAARSTAASRLQGLLRNLVLTDTQLTAYTLDNSPSVDINWVQGKILVYRHLIKALPLESFFENPTFPQPPVNLYHTLFKIPARPKKVKRLWNAAGTNDFPLQLVFQYRFCGSNKPHFTFLTCTCNSSF